MPVTLQVTSGHSTGRRIHVARGQLAKIGRTEWADFSFPNDAVMADIHFVIKAEGADCSIRDSSGGIGTLVNGEPVTETALHTGDTVTAGQTVFSVEVEGESAPSPAADAVVTESSPTVNDGPPRPPDAADYCRPLKMSDAAKALLADGMMPADYLNLITEKELFLDAVRFLAFWLPRPVAVAWGCDCVQQAFEGKLAPKDQMALDAARSWSKEPNQSNCRTAEKLANETGLSGPASWLALAAFWSGDSLVPADLSPVPPGEGLTSEAIAGSLMLAAIADDPGKAPEKYRAYLDAGRQRIPELVKTA